MVQTIVKVFFVGTVWNGKFGLLFFGMVRYGMVTLVFFVDMES